MGKAFLGKGWKFPIEVDSTTGRIMISEFEEDIAESIQIIMRTSKGERVMRANFGCGIQDFIFGLTDVTTLHRLESNIQEAIRIWEPRVHEVEIKAAPDPLESGKLLIHVQYLVRRTNNLFNQVYPFYIHEGSK